MRQRANLFSRLLFLARLLLLIGAAARPSAASGFECGLVGGTGVATYGGSLIPPYRGEGVFHFVPHAGFDFSASRTRYRSHFTYIRPKFFCIDCTWDLDMEAVRFSQEILFRTETREFRPGFGLGVQIQRIEYELEETLHLRDRSLVLLPKVLLRSDHPVFDWSVGLGVSWQAWNRRSVLENRNGALERHGGRGSAIAFIEISLGIRIPLVGGPAPGPEKNDAPGPWRR